MRDAWAPAMTAMLLLGACAPDYGAVQDWSRTAAAVAEYRPAPSVVAATPPDALMATQEGVAAWLNAIAFLAADGVLRERDNPLVAIAARIAPVDAEAATAVTNLGQSLAYAARQNYRAPQLAYALGEGDAAFRAALAGLRRQVEALPGDAEAAATAAQYDRLRAGLRDPVALALLAEARALREAEQARREGLRGAYLLALTRIAEGHAVMMERVRVLSQAETARMIRAQEAALRRAAGLLPGIAM
jgi:hypothetical protein